MAAAYESPPRWALCSQLLLAIRSQDVARVKQLLSAGLDVDTRFFINSQERSALCLSVENNDTAMVQLLLHLGASINQADSSGESPLYIACSRGYTGMAEVLLQEARPIINARTLQGTTALHTAAARGSLDLVEKLISHKADVNLQNKSGHTALHLASTGGHSSVCALLLQAGASINILDSLNNTPLHYAVSRNGVNEDTISTFIRQWPHAMRVRNRFGESPLTILIRSNRRDLEDVLATSLKLSQCLLPRLYYSSILGHCTHRGHTPLHLTVIERQIGSTRLLLAAGAEVEIRNTLGQTPLALAARDGTTEAVSLLLSAGARMNGRSLKSYSEVCPLISEMIENVSYIPLKLTAICRRCLTKHFGLSDAVSGMFPNSIADFLQFNTLEL